MFVEFDYIEEEEGVVLINMDHVRAVEPIDKSDYSKGSYITLDGNFQHSVNANFETLREEILSCVL